MFREGSLGTTQNSAKLANQRHNIEPKTAKEGCPGLLLEEGRRWREGIRGCFIRSVTAFVFWLRSRAVLSSSQSKKRPCLQPEVSTLTTTPWPEQGKILILKESLVKGSQDLEDGGGGSPWAVISQNALEATPFRKSVEKDAGLCWDKQVNMDQKA